MDDRIDSGPSRPKAPDGLERVRSSVAGGAFPHPPVLPVVAVLALLVGLSAGLGLAPRSAPSPTASSSAGATAPPRSVVPSAAPTNLAAIVRLTPTLATPATTAPPSLPLGGVTMAQAVAAASKTYAFSDKDVVDVRLVDGSPYYVDPPSSPWVWEIYVRGPGQVPCGGPMPFPHEDATPPYQPKSVGMCADDYDVAIVDYRSGKAVSMSGAVHP